MVVTNTKIDGKIPLQSGSINSLGNFMVNLTGFIPVHSCVVVVKGDFAMVLDSSAHRGNVGISTFNE